MKYLPAILIVGLFLAVLIPLCTIEPAKPIEPIPAAAPKNKNI